VEWQRVDIEHLTPSRVFGTEGKRWMMLSDVALSNFVIGAATRRARPRSPARGTWVD